jgi:hypothetical protein
VKKKLFLSMSVILLSIVAANADIIQITGVDNGSIAYISEAAAPGLFGGSGYTGGVYTGLYNAVDLTTGQTWLTYCIDPIGDINIGNEWNANLTTGSQLATGTAGILSDVTYGGTKDVTAEKYEMISYLADKYYYDLTSANPMANTNNSSTAITDRNDLSLAFWEISRDFNGNQNSLNLSSGNFQVTSGDLSYTNTLLSNAFGSLTNPLPKDFNLAVYAPTIRPSQEFLTFNVPEPGMLSVLGVSLLGMLGFAISRRRK